MHFQPAPTADGEEHSIPFANVAHEDTTTPLSAAMLRTTICAHLQVRPRPVTNERLIQAIELVTIESLQRELNATQDTHSDNVHTFVLNGTTSPAWSTEMFDDLNDADIIDLMDTVIRLMPTSVEVHPATRLVDTITAAISGGTIKDKQIEALFDNNIKHPANSLLQHYTGDSPDEPERQFFVNIARRPAIFKALHHPSRDDLTPLSLHGRQRLMSEVFTPVLHHLIKTSVSPSPASGGATVRINKGLVNDMLLDNTGATRARWIINDTGLPL